MTSGSQRKRFRQPSFTSFDSSNCQLFQTGYPTVEDVAITAVGVGVRILPDGLIGPPTRNSTRSTGAIPCQHQRAGRVKDCTIAGASCPPVIGAVYHGVPGRLTVVRIHEILDPANHGGLGQTVTRRAGWVILDVEHAW